MLGTHNQASSLAFFVLKQEILAGLQAAICCWNGMRQALQHHCNSCSSCKWTCIQWPSCTNIQWPMLTEVPQPVLRIVHLPPEQVWQKQALAAEGESQTYQVVTNGEHSLALSLAWLDLPGQQGSFPILTNDLDMKVRHKLCHTNLMCGLGACSRATIT